MSHVAALAYGKKTIGIETDLLRGSAGKTQLN